MFVSPSRHVSYVYNLDTSAWKEICLPFVAHRTIVLDSSIAFVMETPRDLEHHVYLWEPSAGLRLLANIRTHLSPWLVCLYQPTALASSIGVFDHPLKPDTMFVVVLTPARGRFPYQPLLLDLAS